MYITFLRVGAPLSTMYIRVPATIRAGARNPDAEGPTAGRRLAGASDVPAGIRV